MQEATLKKIQPAGGLDNIIDLGKGCNEIASGGIDKRQLVGMLMTWQSRLFYQKCKAIHKNKN